MDIEGERSRDARDEKEKKATTPKPREGEPGHSMSNNDTEIREESRRGECSSSATQDYPSTASPENTVLDEPIAIAQDAISAEVLRDDVANLPTQDYVSNLPTQDYTSNIFCTSNQSTPKYTPILPAEDFTSDSIDNVNFNSDCSNDTALDLKQNTMYDFHSHLMQTSNMEQDEKPANKAAANEEAEIPFPHTVEADMENDDYM